MTPETIAIAIGLLALIGCACAIVAIQQVQSEQAHLDQLENSVNNPSEWVEVYKKSAKAWLATIGIPLESHAANLLVAVRGGWAGGKLPTIGELHSVIVRRERSRIQVRLSSGIAATLLIFGIAGTLLGIHPLLKDFKIDTAADGTVQEASASARNVMDLVSGLGRAFLPSMAALIGTLAVVTLRGWYVHKAHSLAQRIDLFAADILMPAFRISTQEEVMAGVKDRLTSLTNRLEERDLRFATAVESLVAVILQLEQRTPALEHAISSVAKASEGLATGTNSVSNALDRNFGPEAPTTKSMVLIENLSGKIADSYTELVKSSSKLNETTNSASRKLTTSADRLAASAKELPSDLKTSVSEIMDLSTGSMREVIGELGQARTNLESSVSTKIDFLNSAVAGQLEVINLSVKTASEKILTKLDVGVANASERLSAEAETAITENSAHMLGRMAGKIDSAVEATTKKIEPLLTRLEQIEKSLGEKVEMALNLPSPLPGSVEHPAILPPQLPKSHHEG